MRVGLAVGGLSAAEFDHFPYLYINSGNPSDQENYPLELTFAEYFQQYANIRSFEITPLLTFDEDAIPIATAGFNQFGVVDNGNPDNDRSPPFNERQIHTRCNQHTIYSKTSPPESYPVSFAMNLRDVALSTITGENTYFPAFLVDYGTILNTFQRGPLFRPSAAVVLFCGHPVELWEPIAGGIFAGAIVIEPDAYWGYDGIWDEVTGAQLIDPIPHGL